MSPPRIELSLGPLLFNWPAQRIIDFYAMVAEETAVERIYLGEVVCGKRAPFVDAALAEAAARLERAGKEVVWSTMALPATPRDRRAARDLVRAGGLVEINDVSALTHLRDGQAFVAGPFLNIYNEVAAAEMMRLGCARLSANVEMPLASIGKLAGTHPGLEIEVFAYGRLPLALSARCYHARAHGLNKDNCQYVCDHDLDGMPLATIEGEPVLAANGIQTLSHGVHVLDAPLDALRAAGITALRLSPHSTGMRRIAEAFRRFTDDEIGPDELRAQIRATHPPGPLVDGYVKGLPGMTPAAA